MISVVVSVYNVEEYLDKCMNSLLSQKYRDFEIILIDDGSTDNSGKKCDEWESKAERIKVIHKKNGGVSSTRNCGIKHAKGEWIIFPDPDDWVESDYLQKLIDIRVQHKADFSICGHYYSEKIWNMGAKPELYDREKAIEYLMYPDSFSGYTWNKLYSMDIIKSNKLFFDEELGTVQDLHFNVRYFQLCDRVAYNPMPLYHYVIHDSSVSSVTCLLTPRKICGLVSYEKNSRVAPRKVSCM